MCAYKKRSSDNYSGKRESDLQSSFSEQSSISKYDHASKPPENSGRPPSEKLKKLRRDGRAIDSLLHKTQDLRAREVKSTLFARRSSEKINPNLEKVIQRAKKENDEKIPLDNLKDFLEFQGPTNRFYPASTALKNRSDNQFTQDIIHQVQNCEKRLEELNGFDLATSDLFFFTAKDAISEIIKYNSLDNQSTDASSKATCQKQIFDYIDRLYYYTGYTEQSFMRKVTTTLKEKCITMLLEYKTLKEQIKDWPSQQKDPVELQKIEQISGVLKHYLQNARKLYCIREQAGLVNDPAVLALKNTIEMTERNCGVMKSNSLRIFFKHQDITLKGSGSDP